MTASRARFASAVRSSRVRPFQAVPKRIVGAPVLAAMGRNWRLNQSSSMSCASSAMSAMEAVCPATLACGFALSSTARARPTAMVSPREWLWPAAGTSAVGGRQGGADALGADARLRVERGRADDHGAALKGVGAQEEGDQPGGDLVLARLPRHHDRQGNARAAGEGAQEPAQDAGLVGAQGGAPGAGRNGSGTQVRSRGGGGSGRCQ